MSQIPYLLILEWCVRLAVGLLIVLRRRAATAALAWLVVVAFVPLFGAAAYFLVGENRLGRRRVKKYERIIRDVRHAAQLEEDYRQIVQPQITDHLLPTARLAEAVGAGAPLGGNGLMLLSRTDEAMADIVEQIDAAEHHCHLLFYIFQADAVGQAVSEALARATRRGVACRILADAVGSKPFLTDKLRADMQRAGVRIVPVMPVNALRAAVARLDLRNHRKLAILDGRVAYTGSHNLSGPIYPRKEKYGAWVDASVRIRGPAVHALQEIFLRDWAFNCDETIEDSEETLYPKYDRLTDGSSPVQVLPAGPDCDSAPLADVMLQAIRSARRRVVLTTPYFVPDETMITAIRSVALRGAEVVLVVPRHSDNIVAQAAGRSHYGYLLDVNVQIYEFTAGLLHAKTLTVDRELAIIGSANLDVRSFMLNFELALLVYDTDFASHLHFLQQSYINRSERLMLAAWQQRGAVRIVADNIAKLATPLL